MNTTLPCFSGQMKKSYCFLEFVCICVCSVTQSRPNSWQPHRLYHTRLFCPCDFPGKNTGVGCRFLLEGIFLTQQSNLHLPHWQVDSLPLSHLGSPSKHIYSYTLNPITLLFTLEYKFLGIYKNVLVSVDK